MSLSSRRRRQALSVTPVAIVMAIGGSVGTAAHASPQRAPSATLISTVNFQIRDHEDVGKDTNCTRWSQTRNTVRYLPQDFSHSGKCGGEIRVEIHYQADLNSDNSLTIDRGRVLFFEGTSEDTRDLDGGLTFGFPGAPIIVPPGESVSRTYYVENSAEGERDDHAYVTVDWRNVRNYQLGRVTPR
ncbi:hypothetical protein GCM10017778_32740 [Streptomyces vinaceus]|nr:hypothetical protein GCM10017778_32740 [Streptomyces vinaceus]